MKECVKPWPPVAKRILRKVREGPRVEGDLSEIDLPNLLHRLHGLRATGVLMITGGKKKKAIQLRDGYPVAVKSNLVGECLGNYLVRTGKLSSEAVTESLARMQKGEGLQGQILVAMDVISEEEIAAALRQQAESKLYEIFSWRRGGFKLEIGTRLKRGNTLALETSPANIILEGARNWSPGERVDAFMARHGHRPVSRAQSPFYRFQDVDLSGAEQRMLEGLDGRRSLRDLAGEDGAMQRALFGLACAELLALEGEPVEVATVPRIHKPVAPRSSGPVVPGAAPSGAEAGVDLAGMAERLRDKSHFEVLEVSENATTAQIDAAFERLAKQVHPDRHTHASESRRQLARDVFQLLARAHEAIADPKLRQEYRAQCRKGERQASRQARNQKAVQAEVDFQHGESLLKQRDYEGALGHFSRAREACPREGEYLAHYAWCLYLRNPENAAVVQEALGHLRRAVRMARDQEKPYLFIGRLCKVVGDGMGAEQMFTRAVEIKPDCVEAMRELRLINMRRDKGRGLIGRLLRL